MLSSPSANPAACRPNSLAIGIRMLLASPTWFISSMSDSPANVSVFCSYSSSLSIIKALSNRFSWLLISMRFLTRAVPRGLLAAVLRLNPFSR